MNWIEEAKKIKKQYDDAKGIYNNRMLKQKRDEYQKEAEQLLAAYNKQSSQRQTAVKARLKELKELIKPTPVFNFDHYFKDIDVTDKWGAKVGTERVIDVEYIAGIKHLKEYVENTLTRLNNYDDYYRAITEITDNDNKQAIEVLYNITANGFKPTFITDDEAWKYSLLGPGARVANANSGTTPDYTVQNVRTLHDVVHERYKDVTYPEGLRDLEKEQKALINENLTLSGSQRDVTRDFLYETVTQIGGDQLFNEPAPKW